MLYQWFNSFITDDKTEVGKAVMRNILWPQQTIQTQSNEDNYCHVTFTSTTSSSTSTTTTSSSNGVCCCGNNNGATLIHHWNENPM